jgi:hypothetical protein
VHTCTLSVQEDEVEGSQVQGQPRLHRGFQANLGYIVRPCLKKKLNHKIKTMADYAT